jgi:hypothetical protein
MRRWFVLFAAPLLLPLGGMGPMPPRVDDVACKFRAPVEEVESYKKLPAPVRAFVEKQFGAMADKGEAYNRTLADSGKGPPRRFLRGGHAGNGWFIWYKQGGIGLTTHIFAFDAKPGRPPRELGRKMFFANQQDPCALTDELLARR